jgi:hypothetical protein
MANGKGLLDNPRYIILTICSMHLLIKSFLASSVAVKHVFSKGCLLMSHICSHLSAQSTRTLLCLGAWSKANFVKSTDLSAVAMLPDAKDNDLWSDDGWEVM